MKMVDLLEEEVIIQFYFMVKLSPQERILMEFFFSFGSVICNKLARFYHSVLLKVCT